MASIKDFGKHAKRHRLHIRNRWEQVDGSYLLECYAPYVEDARETSQQVLHRMLCETFHAPPAQFTVSPTTDFHSDNGLRTHRVMVEDEAVKAAIDQWIAQYNERGDHVGQGSGRD